MNFKPINFVVLRTSGIPINYLPNFNFSDNLISLIRSKREMDEATGEKIISENEKISKNLLYWLKDNRLRDMIRISTPNYSSFIKSLYESKSLLSQYYRKLMMYLQRGMTKCCTAGSYGPVAIGEFEHSSKNISLFKEKAVRFIKIEDWALRQILKKHGISVSDINYLKLLEDYHLLKDFNNEELNEIVKLLDEFADCLSIEERDIAYNKIIALFDSLIGMKSKPIISLERRKDYEGRAVLYELAKRDFSFQVGSQLKKDIDLINNIFGIYLSLVIKKIIQEVFHNSKLNSSSEIAEYIFSNFKDISDTCVNSIIRDKICSFSGIDYPYEIMPPIFSPDLSLEAASKEAINKGDYKIVMGEIHVSSTVISNPMYEFERAKLMGTFISSLKSITNDQLIFDKFSLKDDMDFTYHLPLGFQEEVVNIFNKDARGKSRIYSYRGLHFDNKSQLSNFLFFPLFIGKRLIFGTYKEKNYTMWSRDYLPGVILRIAKELYPSLYSRLLIRKGKIVDAPKISFPENIKPHFVFDMFKEISMWKEKNGISDEIFVKYSDIRKPIYINLKNPLLVYEFFKLSKTLSNIEVLDFLPARNNLWLHDDGGQYCSEFRYMVCPFTDSRKIFSPANSKTLIYFSGIYGGVDELVHVKNKLFEAGFNIDVLNIDYNRDFDEVANEVAKYIRDNYSEKISIFGISLGAVLSFKVATLLGNKVKFIFPVNPFYQRSNITRMKDYEKNFQNFSVKDFLPDTKIVLFSGGSDSRIPPTESLKISKLRKDILFMRVDEADHMFSRQEHQEVIANKIIEILSKHGT